MADLKDTLRRTSVFDDPEEFVRVYLFTIMVACGAWLYERAERRGSPL